MQDVLSKKLEDGENILGEEETAYGASPPAEIGELPKARKQRGSTVQPLTGRPTGSDALIYCLNRSDTLPKLPGASLLGSLSELCTSGHYPAFFPR